MCLSLSDSVVSLTGFPSLSIASFVEYTGYFLEDIYLHIHICVSCSRSGHMTTMWVTLLIAVNRYIIVCLPLRASVWCTDRKVKIQLAVVLLFAVLYASADTLTGFGNWGITAIPVFHPTLDIILPICILTLLNIRLITALTAHRRMQMQNQSSQKNDSMTFVLVIVVAVLIICQLPRIAILMLILTPSLFITSGIECSLLPISNVLVVFNSAFNFYIYIFFNKAFRDVLIHAVCKRHVPRQAVIAHEIVDIE